jgi:hypothetical protein
MTTQQTFLREAATVLGLTQKALAERMGAPWATFEKWLAPSVSGNAREMPEMAWVLVREILAHEKLKVKLLKLQGTK